MVSLSLMITYIKHLRYSANTKYFGSFYYIQIDPQDYDKWRITPPEEEVHFQTPSKLGSPATPRSMATSEASESYITLTNFKKGIKRDASAYPIFKNERYYNTFIRHFKATAKAQGLNSLMHPNFTPGSDEYEQQLFQEQQDFLYSVLIYPSRLISVKFLSRIMREISNSSLNYYMSIIQATLSTPDLRSKGSPSI